MRVAAVGAGAWGRNIVRTLGQIGVLSALVEADSGVRERTSTEAGVPGCASLDELEAHGVEAVAIATPAHTHAELVGSALRAGYHVFVEKPLCLSADEAEALCRHAEERGRILMVGHLLLYHPAVAVLRAAIHTGEIGQLLSLHQERLNFGRARTFENALWSLGVHDVAVAQYLIGSAPHHVTAVGQSVLNSGVADDVTLHVRHTNGVQSHLHVSWLWPERRRRTTAIGSCGMLVLDELEQTVALHRKVIAPDLSQRDEGTAELYRGAAEPLRLELEHFVECCAKGSEPLSSGRSAVPVLRVLEQADRVMWDA